MTKRKSERVMAEDKKKTTTWYIPSKGIYGDLTKELNTVWCSILGDSVIAPEDIIQSLFNEVDLYPSKSQIFEMMHCARESCVARESLLDECEHCKTEECPGQQAPQADDNAAAAAAMRNISSYLTFGEFCVFASELKRKYEQQEEDKRHKSTHGHRRHCKGSPSPGGASDTSSGSSSNCSLSKKSPSDSRSQKSSSTSSAYDVFLGGSCNPTTWRADTAIPFLKGKGITYYNPQQPNWVPEMIALEQQAKLTSKVLLFMLANSTRNVVSMIEISYLSGGSHSKGKRLVVVMEKYPERDHRICTELLSAEELGELSSGLITVSDLVERQGLPIFQSLDVALNCTTKVIHDNISIERLTVSDAAKPVKYPHLQIGDKLLRMREAFSTMDSNQSGKISLADVKMAFRIHTHKDLSQKDIKSVIKAHDPTSYTAEKASGAYQLSSTFYRHSSSELLLDFNMFCCLVAEFMPTKQQTTTATRSKSGKGVLHSFSRKVKAILHRSPEDGTSSKSHCPAKAKRCNNHVRRSRGLRCSGSRRGSSIRDVYLGGSCSGNWRDSEAVPFLKKHGLTFFRAPSKSDPSFLASAFSNGSCRRRLMPIESSAMDNSRMLLFVILFNSRSLSAMCEAAYYCGLRRNSVVLCVQRIPEDSVLDTGETPTKQALKDYNRGRSYLSDIANCEGVPVFESISEAMECVVQKCRCSC